MLCSIIEKVALTDKKTFLNSFLTSKCFDLFQVTFLFKFFSLSSKSVFFTKSALVAKFACFNLLNCGVVMYLLWSGILFSTGVTAVVVAKLVILGILSFYLIYFSIKRSIVNQPSNAMYFVFNLIYFSIKSSINS